MVSYLFAKIQEEIQYALVTWLSLYNLCKIISRELFNKYLVWRYFFDLLDHIHYWNIKLYFPKVENNVFLLITSFEDQS